MVGRIVICILVSASVGTAYAQQVEIPRENAAKVAHQTKTAVGQPQIEAVSPAVPVSYTTASTTKPALSIEQMRQAGALAGQRVREEMHDIEEDEPPPKSTAPAKKEISANAVRAIERPSHEAEALPAPQGNSTRPTAFVRLAGGFD